jgi:hypothetical protein
MPKTFRFFNQMEQEHGDELGQQGADGQKLELTLPDGWDLTRADPKNDEDYTYTVMEGQNVAFKFTILPPVEIPNMPIPAAVILREKGDDKEGTLQS